METGLFLQTGLSKPRRPTFHVWLRPSRKCAKPRDFIFQLYVSRDPCSQRNFSNTERDWAFALLSECGFNFTLSIVAQPVVLQVHGLRLVTPKAESPSHFLLCRPAGANAEPALVREEGTYDFFAFYQHRRHVRFHVPEYHAPFPFSVDEFIIYERRNEKKTNYETGRDSPSLRQTRL